MLRCIPPNTEITSLLNTINPLEFIKQSLAGFVYMQQLGLHLKPSLHLRLIGKQTDCQAEGNGGGTDCTIEKKKHRREILGVC